MQIWTQWKRQIISWHFDDNSLASWAPEKVSRTPRVSQTALGEPLNYGAQKFAILLLTVVQSRVESGCVLEAVRGNVVTTVSGGTFRKRPRSVRRGQDEEAGKEAGVARAKWRGEGSEVGKVVSRELVFAAMPGNGSFWGVSCELLKPGGWKIISVPVDLASDCGAIWGVLFFLTW